MESQFALVIGDARELTDDEIFAVLGEIAIVRLPDELIEGQGGRLISSAKLRMWDEGRKSTLWKMDIKAVLEAWSKKADTIDLKDFAKAFPEEVEEFTKKGKKSRTAAEIVEYILEEKFPGYNGGTQWLYGGVSKKDMSDDLLEACSDFHELYIQLAEARIAAAETDEPFTELDGKTPAVTDMFFNNDTEYNMSGLNKKSLEAHGHTDLGTDYLAPLFMFEGGGVFHVQEFVNGEKRHYRVVGKEIKAVELQEFTSDKALKFRKWGSDVTPSRHGEDIDVAATDKVEDKAEADKVTA